MTLSEVTPGMRCYAISAQFRTVAVDQYGQNATVEKVVEDVWPVCIIGDNGVREQCLPGFDIFHCKPVPPERPKRKVMRTFDGFVSPAGAAFLEAGKSMSFWPVQTDPSYKRATITYEDEE